MTKMLIIDDAEEICFAISEFFRIKDFHVDVAYNMESALELLREEKYHIILLDYNMPYINGIVGTRLIRQIDKNVVIIALTALEDEDLAESFFQAGVNDFSVKPIKLLDLYYRINSHLKKEKPEEKKKIEEKKISYPKGIDKNTYELIEKALKNKNDYTDVEEISLETGVAYKTINRYLNFMIDIEVIEVNLIYGKIGRPKKEYKWIEKL